MNQKRQPKGIPAGGEFAGGVCRANNASDLAEQDMDEPSMFDGVDWRDVGPVSGRTLRFRELRGKSGARLFRERIAELKRTSVFSYKGERAGNDIVAKAVEQGARRLDCYDIHGYLPHLYGKQGFTPIAYVDWNDKYAPDGSNYENMGRPRVAAMALTDRDVAPVEHVGYDEAVDMAKHVARDA